VVRYDEGIHIGYRAWLKAGTEPAYPFGHGLGYTTWSLDGLVVDDASLATAGAATATATVTLTNTGDRAGKQVVQVYASRAESAIDRPVRWLVGFAPVTAEPGETVSVDIRVPERAFANWQDGWHYETGEYLLEVGTSVSELPLSATVTLL
jgi:beta-glucosidase